MGHNQYTLLVEETNRRNLFESDFFDVINEAEEGGFFSKLGAKIGGSADKGVEKVKNVGDNIKQTAKKYSFQTYRDNKEYVKKAQKFLDNNKKTGKLQKLFWNSFGTDPKILTALYKSLVKSSDDTVKEKGSTLLLLLFVAGGKEKGGNMFSKSGDHLLQSKDKAIRKGATRALDAITGENKGKDKESNVTDIPDQTDGRQAG